MMPCTHNNVYTLKNGIDHCVTVLQMHTRLDSKSLSSDIHMQWNWQIPLPILFRSENGFGSIKQERPDRGTCTVEPLDWGNHLCTSVCVLHREVNLIQIRSTSLGLQAVSSIERCPPFTFLYMLYCIQIHIAIQIPSQVTLYAHTIVPHSLV